MKEKACPCCSGKTYDACCGRFHRGEIPKNALELMQARYSAYALDLPSFIIATTHPQNPHYRKDQVSWVSEITRFSKSTEFRKLEISEFTETADTATVTFTVYLSQGNSDVTFTEKSYFQKVDGRWLYKDAELSHHE